MSWSLSPELPHPIPPRPNLTSQQSSSLPASPYQLPRDLPLRTRSPSLGREVLNTSPRSTHSESGHSLPSFRNLQGGCKYEVAQAHLKRRIPYSEGSEKLPPPSDPLKNRLSPEEDKRLGDDMRVFYGRLLPTPESEERRRKLVEKLEQLLNTRWPGHKIKANVFGSTGNKLGTNDSDVDISVTTDCKALENVCNLADLFAKKGMERVICIASAKVPIVKIWDPELQLACDLNVNQHVALENTEMIKAYVELDDRVRPLAMIIKHWTRKRILNDAGRNFTLSSYTWICLIINFLQTRNPPILPTLQQQPGLTPKKINSLDVSFARDTKTLRDFGSGNTESIGQLLFQFFLYYGYELDYETSVLSVREGKVLPKSGNWQRQQNNRLCVEEPFNTSRNLGNTADDTSFRGVHLELRRAYKLVSEAGLSLCCEQFEFPAEEPRPAIVPAPRPSQPISVQPSRSTRGNRGGRNGNQFPRSQPQGRRASSASNRAPQSQRGPQPWAMTAQELSLQAQQQRYLLHDHLYQQYQMLQAQEQELRMQLQQQALRPSRTYSAMLWPQLQFPYQTHEFSHDEMSRARAGTVNHPPLTAPLHQGNFHGSPFLPPGTQMVQGTTTTPPSPSMTSAVPDLRRNPRRSSLASGSATSSLRAHSQPAQRPLRSPLQFHVANFEHSDTSSPVDPGTPRRQMPMEATTGDSDSKTGYFEDLPSAPVPSYIDPRRQSEYVGYYVGHSPPSHAQPRTLQASPMNAQQGLGIGHSDLPTRGPIIVDSSKVNNRNELSTSTPRSHSTASTEATTTATPIKASTQATPNSHFEPLVIDGSVPMDRRKPTMEGTNGHINGYDAYSSSPEATNNTNGIVSTQNSSYVQPSRANGNGVVASHEVLTGREGPGIMHGHPPTETESVSPPKKTATKPIPLTPSESDNEPTRILDQDPFQDDDRSKPQNADRVNPLIPRMAPILSPVKEVRTPSPSSGRGGLMSGNTDKISSSVNRTKPKGKADKTSPMSPRSQDQEDDALSPKTNGPTANGSVPFSPNGSQHANGWQTQKKKHKKGTKSTNDIGTVNPNGGEFMPVDEKMRKGG